MRARDDVGTEGVPAMKIDLRRINHNTKLMEESWPWA